MATQNVTNRSLLLIGRLSTGRQLQVLIGLLAFLLLVDRAVVAFDTRQSTIGTIYIATAGKIRMLSQRLAKAAQQASQGNTEAFTQLRESRDEFAAQMQLLLAGGSSAGTSVPATSGRARPVLEALDAEWKKNDRNAALVAAEEKNLLALGQSVRLINERNPALQELADEVAALSVQTGGSARQNAITAQLMMLTQRLAKNANTMLAEAVVDPEVSFLLGKDVNTFRDLLQGLLQGSETQRIQRVGDAERLNAAYEQDLGARTLNYIVLAVVSLLALGVLLLVGKVYLDDSRRRADESEQQNKVNQQAIQRLLDEITNLANGDLTVRAQVTEHVTGAIADSINYTIDELRRLVAGITDASQQVTSATKEAQTVSSRLLDAAQKQAGEIQGAGQSVAQMAEAMMEVSRKATDSSKVAEASLHAAEKGAGAVQAAVRGMNDIRDQIQETSKRIKRLGESSQEIGEIVQLISDITEQTNVLALNAAIQAASAGEAGRGFTVVAEEVQRLAERSAEATKHISAIVKSIQRDTQEAVEAMERSTQGVVEGTKTADEADRALREIEQVSNRLAELIGAISNATQEQANSATRVAASMREILGITQLTTEGTRKTAASAATLTT